MPTYEYRCRKCSNTFELFQKITAKPVARCPRCRGRAVRLLSAGAGLVFKGSGFYATDYRSSGEKAKRESAEGGGDMKASGKAGEQSTEKPATPSHKKKDS